MTTATVQKVDGFAGLVGHVLTRVTVNTERDEVIFELADGRSFRLFHQYDCCESMHIEDIEGAIDENVLVDLVGEVVLAVEDSREATGDEAPDSGTWTFYRIGTVSGTVVMRWLGQSNGYYSEEVDFGEVGK